MEELELIKIYSKLLNEMRARGMIRSKNITGDLGEYMVINYYNKTRGLPKLQMVPPSTKNIDAISANGERYLIKCTTIKKTGAFYGLEKDADYNNTKQLFEYVVIIKLDATYQVELILKVDWKIFFKHKRWDSRVKANNLSITKSLISDSKIIYQK